MNIADKVLGSFDNITNNAFSGRKLTAWWAVLVGTAVTYALPDDAKLHALYAWQLLALLCLGIITFEQIIKLRTGQTGTTTETTTTTSETKKE